MSHSTSMPSAAKKPSSCATKSLRPIPFGATRTFRMLPPVLRMVRLPLEPRDARVELLRLARQRFQALDLVGALLRAAHAVLERGLERGDLALDAGEARVQGVELAAAV